MLRPDFDKALLQRAKLYASDGDFSLAKHDLLQHKEHKSNKEVKELVSLNTIESEYINVNSIYYSWNLLNTQKRQVYLV